MSILLLIGTFEAFFLLLLLFGKKEKTPADKYLGGFLGILGLTILLAYLEVYNSDKGYPLPSFLNLSWMLLFLHGPALWFYIKSLTIPNFRPGAIQLLHFFPFFVFLVIQYINFIQLPSQEKIYLVKNEIFRESLFYTVSVAGIGISTLSYNIWALLLIQQHRKSLVQQYSQIENIDLEWLRMLTLASVIVYALNVFLFNLNSIISFASYIALTRTVYIFATIYVLVIGYFGLRQGRVFANVDSSQVIQTFTSFTRRPAGTNHEHAGIIEKLERLMAQEQPYLEPEITLTRLSELLNVRPDFLSDLLNNSIHKNFFDFINFHRVEEFKIQSLNKDKQHLSILGLAYECGFNSKAAFYRAFKKFEGISPTAFIEKSHKK